jgi:hypothetical protein
MTQPPRHHAQDWVNRITRGEGFLPGQPTDPLGTGMVRFHPRIADYVLNRPDDWIDAMIPVLTPPTPSGVEGPRARRLRLPLRQLRPSRRDGPTSEHRPIHLVPIHRPHSPP